MKKLYEKLGNVGKVSFWVTLITSIVLIVVSFFLPPTGAIDPSVMAAVGEMFAFGTLGTVLFAITKGVDAKLTHGNTSVNLTNPDPKYNYKE